MTVNETLLALTHCVIATASLRGGRQSQIATSLRSSRWRKKWSLRPRACVAGGNIRSLRA